MKFRTYRFRSAAGTVLAGSFLALATVLAQAPPALAAPDGVNNACGPGKKPSIGADWPEAADTLSGSELPHSTARLRLTNSGAFAAVVQVFLNFQRGGESTRHALDTIPLASRETLEIPVDLLAYRSADGDPGDLATSSISAYLRWTDAGLERGGDVISPTLYFFQRPTGLISVFGEAELSRRLRSGGDLPEARLLDSYVPETGTELEMIFQVGADQGLTNPITHDETAAFDEERRLRAARRTQTDHEIPTHSESHP